MSRGHKDAGNTRVIRFRHRDDQVEIARLQRLTGLLFSGVPESLIHPLPLEPEPEAATTGKKEDPSYPGSVDPASQPVT